MFCVTSHTAEMEGISPYSITHCQKSQLSFPKCFTEFSEFSDKIFVTTVKWFAPATFCVRDQDATTAPARYM